MFCWWLVSHIQVGALAMKTFVVELVRNKEHEETLLKCLKAELARQCLQKGSVFAHPTLLKRFHKVSAKAGTKSVRKKMNQAKKADAHGDATSEQYAEDDVEQEGEEGEEEDEGAENEEEEEIDESEEVDGKEKSRSHRHEAKNKEQKRKANEKKEPKQKRGSKKDVKKDKKEKKETNAKFKTSSSKTLLHSLLGR